MIKTLVRFFNKKQASNEAIYHCFRLLVRVEGFKPYLYTLPAKFSLSGATFGLGVDVGQWRREELEAVVNKHWSWACEFVFHFPQVFEVHYALRDLVEKASFAKDPKSYILGTFELDKDCLFGAIKNLFLLKNPDLRKIKVPTNNFVASLPVSLAVLKHFVDSFLSAEGNFPENYLPIAIAICWQHGLSGGRRKFADIFADMRAQRNDGVMKKIEANISFGSFPERWKTYKKWVESEMTNANQ